MSFLEKECILTFALLPANLHALLQFWPDALLDASDTSEVSV